MPRNGLALPVRVGSQIDRVAFLPLFFQVLYQFLFSFDLHIVWLKTMFNVDSQLTFRQIPNMPHGGDYIVVLPEIFLDSLCFCGGLHNNKF